MSEPRIAWVAADAASQAVLELARKVADTSTTLLITGESGTGKDHLARLIHELSPRRDAPYLKIDCASLPQELVESELFGHERGAFTGAVERKLGRLEMAGDGTIVLDEVAALSPATQSKLLRVLEERQFERLGGTETLTIQARLIALTNADLHAPVSAGQFREELIFPPERADHSVPGLARASRRHPAARRPSARRAGRVHGRPECTFRSRAPDAGRLRLARQRARAEKLHRARPGLFQLARTLAAAGFSGIRAVRGHRPRRCPALARRDRTRRHRATLEATHYKIGKAPKSWASAARRCSISARSTG